MLEIIKAHVKKYPQMQPQDAVKLIYQSELGVGHLIKSADMFYERLISEFTSLDNIPSESFVEDIGGGYVRVDLNRLDTERLSLDSLSELCLRSAEECVGTLSAFTEKLDLLSESFRELSFEFSERELFDFITAYKNIGMPPISHSDTYRALYKPAYRVVSKNLIDLYLKKTKGNEL